MEPFPNPSISKCIIRWGKLCDENNETKPILECTSGRYYYLDRELAKSLFGHVMEGILVELVEGECFRKTEVSAFVKVISKRLLEQYRGKCEEDPLNEIAALQYIGNDNVNVIGQMDCCEDDRYIYLVMRYVADGNLLSLINCSGAVEEEDAKHMFKQVIDGLNYLHGLGVAHRDLDPERILFDATAKQVSIIIDSGLCRRLHRKESSESQVLSVADQFDAIENPGDYGKRAYIAPEVLAKEPVYHPMVADVWSAGIVLFMMLTGQQPFRFASIAFESYRTIVVEHHLDGLLSQWFESHYIHRIPSMLAIDLLQKILRASPEERLTIEAIRRHPWLTNTEEEG